MVYLSSLTGQKIINESTMITIQFMDHVTKSQEDCFFADYAEVMKWWSLPKPRPNEGGVFPESSFDHSPIKDESQKITVYRDGNIFEFLNEDEAQRWHKEIIKEKITEEK